jgi:L-threonylcarbamoyladenylate synthase
MNFKTRLVANILTNGGVVSLPTDTIQGLSCLPYSNSLKRLIELKNRPTNKGLILLSDNINHFNNYVQSPKLLKKIIVSEQPTTYIIKANKNVSKLLLGKHNTVALRLVNNPLIASLCTQTNSVLVSTSANISGRKVANNTLKLRVYFKNRLDYIISPNIGNNTPSIIINLHTGEKLR